MLIYPLSTPGTGGVINLLADPAETTDRYNIPEEVREDAIRLLDDSTFDDDIPSWVRHGCVDTSTKTLSCEGIDFIEMTTDLDYSDFSGIPPGFAGGGHDFNQIIYIYSVAYMELNTPPLNAYEGLMRVHPRMQGHVSGGKVKDEGPPKFYYFFDKTLGLFPAFKSDPPVGHVKIFYCFATDEFHELPEEVQPFILYFVAYMAKLKEKKMNDAATFYNQYMNAITQYRYDIWERPPDSKEMMQVPDKQVVVGQ